MNIFVLSEDPKLAALYTCDRHVVKMILESAQMLSTVHRAYSDIVEEKVYRSTHVKHPCVLWLTESKANYNWLVKLFYELELQYEARYGKKHASYVELYEILKNAPNRLPDGSMTPFVQAMPDQYKGKDAITAYRKYYISEKTRFATWREPASIPYWFKVKRL